MDMKRPDMKGVISGYDIVYETPARRWEDGLPIGNGSLGCLAYAPTHPEWVVNKNDVYDYRNAPFRRLKHREVVRLVERGKGPLDLAALENPADVAYSRFPCPKTCGQIRIRFGHPTIYAPPHRISQRLRLYESSALFSLDKHLSHPRITSFVHAEEDILAIRVRDVSCMVAFHNFVDLWRERDSEIVDARLLAENDTIALRQEFPDGFHYVMAARIIPQGTSANRDVFRRHVRRKHRDLIRPSEKIQSRIEGKFSVAPVSGDFDLFLTVVSSLDSKNPMRSAKKRLSKFGRRTFDNLRKSHLAWWEKFWKKSWVELCDGFKNQLWYSSVHALGSTMRKAPAPGLCGLWYGPMDTPSQILPWRGTYTNDYNAQVPSAPVFRINHPELSECFFRTLRNQLPQVKKDTRELYDAPGAMYPLSSDPTGREITGGGYRYCQCSGPLWGILLWWHFLYTRDKKFLAEVSYPVLREIVIFFHHMMEFDKKDARYHLYCSQPPEFEYLNYPDPTYTLVAFKYVLKGTLEASEILGKDARKRKEWRHLLEHFPPYPVADGVITDARGMPANHFQEFSGGLAMAFPCGEADREMDYKKYRLSLNTLDNVMKRIFWPYSTSKGRNMAWTGHLYKIGTAALWLGRPDIARRILKDILRCSVKPSGLITHNLAVWAPSGKSEKNIEKIPDKWVNSSDGRLPYRQCGMGWAEQECTEDPACKQYIFPAHEGPGAYLTTIGEMLLQSQGGLIRLFPGMKKNESASFFRLRAEGPVLVSSALVKGAIRFVRLEGIVKGKVRMINPWPGKNVFISLSKTGRQKKERFGRYIEFEISPRRSLTIAPRKDYLKEADRLSPAPSGEAGPRSMQFDDGSVTWIGKPFFDPYEGPKRILKRCGGARP